jgi:hypothetical protein
MIGEANNVRHSIFSGIVVGENSYTRLLCNLMERNERFRKAVLHRLFSKEALHIIGDHPIRNQKTLRDKRGNHGIADIFIKTPQLSAIVEVKTELGCSTTVNQRWSLTEETEARGYLKYLESQSTSERWFVFLIPRGWKHEVALRHDIAEMANATIRMKTVTWEEIFSEISEDMRGDAILNEFRLHLSERFEPISLTKAEIQMLIDPKTIEAVWKLNKLITLIYQKAKSAGYTVAWEKSHQEGNFGFYFRIGKQDVLYFGCWLSFSKHVSHPLCIGVEDDWGEEFKDKFKISSPFEIVPFFERTAWTMSWVPDQDLDDDDAGDKLWRSIQPILGGIYAT